ncbi:MAG: hypothetical protein H8D23_12130 [Candidatus Brocadiales bacterium]|nr:hypothetical protein [Candidatus Brocadiales bacterium]
MILVFLYAFGIAAMLFPSDPVRLIGVFLVGCFLPGFSLMLVSRDKVGFFDLILSFLWSIGITSVLVLALLYLGLTTYGVALILIALVGVAVIAGAASLKQQPSRVSFDMNMPDIRFCFFALIVTILVGLPVILGGDRMAISFHGFFHSSFLNQLSNGIFPPENPGMGGVPVKYLWGFHALGAVLCAPVNIHPLKFIPLLNLVSFFAVISMGFIIAREINFSEKYAYLVPMAIIGLMHADAGLIFIAKAVLGKFASLRDMQELRPGELYQILGWSQFMPESWFDMRLRFLPKFYNANAMPPAIAFCFAYFISLLKASRVDNYRWLYFAGNGLLFAACGILYPPLLFVMMLHAPMWMIYVVFLRNRSIKHRFYEVMEQAIPLGIAGLIILPYLLSITGGSSKGGESVIQIGVYIQSFRNIIVFWLTLPFIVAGMWLFLKRKAFSEEFYLIVSGVFVCTVLAAFMKLSDDNSYKFSYILCLFFALFFVEAIQRIMTLTSTHLMRVLISLTVILLLISNPVLVAISYAFSPWLKDASYRFSGSHVEFASDTEKGDAFVWIRENTPVDALVMVTDVGHPDDCCGENSTYMPAVITERNLYIVSDGFTIASPEYKKRVEIVRQLLENPGAPEIAGVLESLNRQIYIVIENDMSKEIDLLNERYLSEFQNRTHSIYQLTGGDK